MSIYNVRLYDYDGTQQVRIYKKPVTRKEYHIEKPKIDKQNDSKSKDRSPEAAEHSKQVSQNRTKQVVYELTRSNRWDWFITLTFNPDKIDRSNYELLLATVRKWFNNIKQRKAPAMKYIIIPELHQDGVNYHFHGLLADAYGLEFLDSGIIDKSGKNVYNIPDFRYGFTTATRVESSQKAAAYITKYITKELEVTIKGKRRYLASRNCKRADIYEYNMTPEEKDDILFQISQDITYMNTQHISPAGQLINYVEFQKS